jgi:ankyrin repeat protein
LDADVSAANARGAHGIPIMFHAAMSGDVGLAQLLKDRGCHEGYNSALHGAISYGHTAMVDWLLHNGLTDATTPNWQNKIPLERAQEAGETEIVRLLETHLASS